MAISKLFITAFVLATIVGYGTGSWGNFATIMLLYIIPRIIWNLATK